MKNKILEELLEKHPELAKDNKKLEEIISILKQNNPEIKIDENFKNSLKSRLDSIINYNNVEKKSFFSGLFLIPVLSVFLITGGVFYIYKDMSLLKDNNIKYENTDILEIKEQKNISVEKKDFKNIKSIPEIPKIKEKNTEIITENQNIEDNQILEMLGENTEITDKKILDKNIIEDNSVSLPGSSETMFYDNGINDPYINNFVEYCEEYNSKVLVDNTGVNYCIIEDKICLKSDYSENTCKLTEKK